MPLEPVGSQKIASIPAGTRIVLEHKLPPVWNTEWSGQNVGFCHAEVHPERATTILEVIFCPLSLSSAIVPGQSDISVGAGPVVENVVPQSSGGKTFWAKQLKLFLTSVRTLLIKRILHDHLK